MVHRILGARSRGWGSSVGPWENWASRGKDRDSAAGRDQAQLALDGAASESQLVSGLTFMEDRWFQQRWKERESSPLHGAASDLGAVTFQMLALLACPA